MLDIIMDFAQWYIKSGAVLVVTFIIVAPMIAWQIVKRMPSKNSRKVSARRRSQKKK
ncbi:hypothetical protein [Cyanothece sp. BG0011]|uniref:hypothetical protein n=1 Tax=Cyanothece sp. BG0011 TaxID=2082950 RepID=UPI0013006CE7|nr:hypothetical protein [Cyanothece sp. BG0011]